MYKKLSLVNTSASSLKEVWECFFISKTSKYVSDATLMYAKTYRHYIAGVVDNHRHKGQSWYGAQIVRSWC